MYRWKVRPAWSVFITRRVVGQPQTHEAAELSQEW